MNMDEPTTSVASGLLAKVHASIGFGAIGARERLCPCGIALRACQCPLRRDSAGVRLGSTLAV